MLMTFFFKHLNDWYMFQLAPLESCESDEELRYEAEMTLACLAQTLLQPGMIPLVLSSLQQVRMISSMHY